MTAYTIDINDPFAGMGDDATPASPVTKRVAGEHLAATVADPTKMWPETCAACKGRGKFVSWGGRVVGDCYRCKGAGKRSFRTAPEVRERARERSAERKVENADANWTAFAAEYPALSEWMTTRAPRFEFAASMMQAVRQWGRLTEKQLATVTRLAQADADRKAQVASRSVDVDASKIVEAFDHARSSGLSRIKINLTSTDGFTFVVTPAGATSSNPGALYVKSDDSEYLGKIVEGRFVPVRACGDERRDAFVQVASDPLAAAVAYGRLTGSCSCCGRELTAADSVAAGIGPICAGKMGW